MIWIMLDSASDPDCLCGASVPLTAAMAVLDLSVYNSVSYRGRDDSVFGIVNHLRAKWQPAWGSAEDVITPENIQRSAERLQEYDLISLKDGMLKIANRNAKTGRGRPVVIMPDQSGLGVELYIGGSKRSLQPLGKIEC